MKNLCDCLWLLFVLLATQAFAIVIETKDLELFKAEIERLDDQALVVFDVDYTLLAPKDAVLGPLGETHLTEFKKNVIASSGDWEILASKVLLNSQDSLIDHEVLDLIEKLKEKKIRTIALTAMPTGDLGLIPSMEDWRIEQLNKLGIRFDWSFPTLPPMLFEQFQGGKYSPPSFKNGVICSSRQPKGKVLLEFLKYAQFTPSKVVFLDDRMDYIESMELELGKQGIPLISFHYLAISSLFDELDEEIAAYQLSHLLQHGEWLSDEEVSAKLGNVEKCRP